MGKLPFRIGDKIHEYTIQSEHIRGSMGIIYNAIHTNGTKVLIKAPFVNMGSSVCETFIGEASRILSLRHDSLICVIDSDLTAQIPWYAVLMPPQRTLRDVLQIHRLISPLQATRWMVQLAGVLSYAYNQSNPLFHDCLVPDNIFIQQNKLYLADLGISHFGYFSRYVPSPVIRTLYLAPEQFDRTKKMDIKAEIYSLGTILYEMLSGHPPFGSFEVSLDDDKRNAFLDKVLDPQIRIPPITELPSKMFARILQKSLHKDIKMRYTDFDEIEKDLKKVLREMLTKQADMAETKGNYVEAFRLTQEATQHGLMSAQLERLEKIIKEKNLIVPVVAEEILNRDNFIAFLTKIKSQIPEERKSWQDFLELENHIQHWEECYELFSECLQSIKNCMQEKFPAWHPIGETPVATIEEVKNDQFDQLTQLINKVREKQDELQQQQEHFIQQQEKQTKQYDTELLQEKIQEQTKQKLLEQIVEEQKNKIVGQVVEEKISWDPTTDTNIWETIESSITEDDLPEVVEKHSSKPVLEASDNDSYEDMYDMATIVLNSVDYSEEQEEEMEEYHEDDDEIYVSEGNTPVAKEDIRDHISSKDYEWLDDNTIRSKKDGSEMIYIPQGVFIMGSEAIHSFDVEQPEHEVYLDSFFMDKYPITWKQYIHFCNETKYPKPVSPKWGILETHPVVNITWYDVLKYCEWAERSIPTEAQWEKAARGGIWLDGDVKRSVKNPRPRRKYPWGEEAPNSKNIWRCNYNAEPTYGKNQGAKQTSPIGFFEHGMSPYNIADLSGNVWEWTRDWFSSKYYRQSPYSNPVGPSTPEIIASGNKSETSEDAGGKVLRGGSWYIGTRFIRVTTRRKRNPEACGSSCGMRTILELTH